MANLLLFWDCMQGLDSYALAQQLPASAPLFRSTSQAERAEDS
jgi:hypothetical protein